MMRAPLFAAALSVALPAGGCLDTALRAGAPDASSPATWSAPLTLAPPFVIRDGQPNDMVLALVPGTGFVRATPTTMASIGRPLTAEPGENRTVEPCREALRPEAEKVGAQYIEAASAGPHRRDRQGHYIGAVRVRITYGQVGGYEVREATLTCVVDRSGTVVDAYT